MQTNNVCVGLFLFFKHSSKSSKQPFGTYSILLNHTSGIYFDLAIERVCRIIRKVREENHIADHEATKVKIHTLIMNLHEDRNSRFDYYTYRGKRLSSYTSPEWIEWVEQCVWSEVYAESVNNGRTYTNVQTVYDRIKIDFYHKLNQE